MGRKTSARRNRISTPSVTHHGHAPKLGLSLLLCKSSISLFRGRGVSAVAAHSRLKEIFCSVLRPISPTIVLVVYFVGSSRAAVESNILRIRLRLDTTPTIAPTGAANSIAPMKPKSRLTLLPMGQNHVKKPKECTANCRNIV